MKPFMSLREFLLLRDTTARYDTSVFRGGMMPSKRGGISPYSHQEDSVHRYDAAKASWEEFGQDGPPVGTKVEMLEAGHGGLEGAIRTMEGISRSDPRFFEVSRTELSYSFNKVEKRISLVCRETWFVHMRPHKEK